MGSQEEMPFAIGEDSTNERWGVVSSSGVQEVQAGDKQSGGEERKSCLHLLNGCCHGGVLRSRIVGSREF